MVKDMIRLIPQRISPQRARSLLPGLIGLGVIILVPAHTAASSQGFDLFQGHPQAGMLMSLTSNPGVIEPANTTNAASLIGVISPGDTNIDLQPGQVNVETDGAANALVSTLNGNILVGDRITASSL